MTKGELSAKYQDSTPEGRRRMDLWLKANAAIAPIFAIALVAMALNSSGLPEPTSATAKSAEKGNIAARAKPHGRLSAYELMIRIAPEELPRPDEAARVRLLGGTAASPLTGP
jgi:hypothetical protein